MTSLAYPINPTLQERLAMKDFITIVPLLLPCPSCQQHAHKIITNSNLNQAVQNRDTLFEFWVDFHNAVNIRLKKRIVSVQQARQMYSPLQNWGPSFWFTFHLSSLFYQTQHSRLIKRFLEIIPILLPTQRSQMNSIQFLRNYNLEWAVANKYNLFYFWFDFHNYINKLLGKEELSFGKVKDLYHLG